MSVLRQQREGNKSRAYHVHGLYAADDRGLNGAAKTLGNGGLARKNGKGYTIGRRKYRAHFSEKTVYLTQSNEYITIKIHRKGKTDLFADVL